jgi:hypothetical protein
MDAENRVGRKLADFMDQAQDEVEETEIDSLDKMPILPKLRS